MLAFKLVDSFHYKLIKKLQTMADVPIDAKSYATDEDISQMLQSIYGLKVSKDFRMLGL